jgi:sensor c-di-GMP phosphodiesterase-like protein
MQASLAWRDDEMTDLDAIRTALEKGEFFMEYLPAIDLRSGRCTGAEALIRWRQPSGVVYPEDFIPLVDNTPLSGLITYWVIERVAAELGDWLRAHPEAHVSINAPPEILGRGGMEYVASKCGLLELGPQLIIEITERGVPDTLGVEAINSAAKLGIRVALDDMSLGSAGANLAILTRCDFHIVKLDRSLVEQIAPDNPTPAWVAGVAALLAASPDLTVVAEGVETEQQLLAVRAANIQVAQGFYFSHPLPAEAFIAYYGDAANRLPPSLHT